MVNSSENSVDLGHWHCISPIPEDFYGFIYCITNKTTKRMYIGKKQCKTTVKLPPLKGKKNKRHKVKETDWKSYTGSSEELNKDIESLGKDNFSFEILRFCRNKFELSYFEAKEQLSRDVLLSEQYYNGIINVRIGRAPKETLVDYSKK